MLLFCNQKGVFIKHQEVTIMGQSALVAVIGKARLKVCLHHVSFMESE